MTDSALRRTGFEKWQAVARRLLLLYIPGILYTAMVIVAVFAYGLAHASGGAVSGFLSILGLTVLVALAAPLLLLLPGLSPAMKALKSLAMLILAAGLCVSAAAVWFAQVEPALMTLRFKYAMGALSITGVTEQPLLVDGKVVGLRLGIDVELSRPLPADTQGRRAIEFMQTPAVMLARAESGSREAALHRRGLARISFNGSSLESLPGRLQPGSDGRGPARDAVLPAGVYRVESDWLLVGLDLDKSGVACRADSPPGPALQRLAGTSGRDMVAVLGVRMALRGRLGYRYFQRETAPLRFPSRCRAVGGQSAAAASGIVQRPG